MPKSYYVTVPYCCSVSIRVTVDEEIDTPDDALDAAMDELDSHDACLQFVKKDGKEVDREKVDIGEGQFLKRVSSGNVSHVSFGEIEWEETDG